MKEAMAIFANEVRRISATYGPGIVPSKVEQEEALKKHQNLPDSFFWVLDLRDTSFSEMHGVERFLGTPDETFSYLQFIQRLHPAFQVLFFAKALAVYLIINQFKKFAKPDTHFYYNVFVPLKLYDGNFYRVRQMSLPFCYDESDNMVAQLNVYRTGLEPYEGQPMTSFFSSSIREPLADPTAKMKEAHIKSLHENVFEKYPLLNPMHKKNWGFSKSQINLLKAFAVNPELSWSEAANIIHRAVDTTSKIWYKELRPNVNELFKPKKFEKIQELVTFLKQMDVLI